MDFYLLVLLICTTPALLMIDSPIAGGAISAILAIALAFSARTIRPGQADHFFVLARPIVFVVAIPAVWILVQILPLGFSSLSNPIWESASVGIGHPMLGRISIDPGLTLLSLSRYFSILAILFLSMVVSIDRARAEWVLFALTAATASTALVLIGDDLGGIKFLFTTENAASRIGALDSATLGLILSSASAIRVFDRFDTQRTKDKSAVVRFAIAILFCVIAFAACAVAISLHVTGYLILAAGSGLAALASVVLIRRLGLGAWGRWAIGSVAIVVAVSVVAMQPASRIAALAAPLLPRITAPPFALTERILAASPWTGTGAGTFAAQIPIYRDADDAVTENSLPNVAMTIAIEAGWPAVWTALLILIAAAAALFRGALRRGRDSFYSAAGAGCAAALVVLSFTDAGMLQTATSAVAAAVLGMAFGQRLSRTIKR